MIYRGIRGSVPKFKLDNKAIWWNPHVFPQLLNYLFWWSCTVLTAEDWSWSGSLSYFLMLSLCTQGLSSTRLKVQSFDKSVSLDSLTSLALSLDKIYLVLWHLNSQYIFLKHYLMISFHNIFLLIIFYSLNQLDLFLEQNFTLPYGSLKFLGFLSSFMNFLW